MATYPGTFYDLEYIISKNEKRIEDYISAYQKVLERFTNIIIIYSAIAIFLVPICQDICNYEIKHWLSITCFVIFACLFLVSLYFTVRLLLPVEVSYLSSPKRYYETIRLQYEQSIGTAGGPQSIAEIPQLLQASYISELEQALDMNILVFTRKSSFYYNALMYGLFSAIPFLICLGFHITKKADNIQKIEIINREKISNLHHTNRDSIMANTNSTNTSSTTSNTTTKLPGVNSAQVIVSSPIIIRENSSSIKKK